MVCSVFVGDEEYDLYAAGDLQTGRRVTNVKSKG
jgi:hypothetical protein